MSEPKHEETFKVVDRRLFTAEGELRKEVAEQQDRENNAAAMPGAAAATGKAPVAGAASASSAAKPAPHGHEPATHPAPDTPKRSPAFENLIRSVGQNAAILLGGYADPQTGQPMLDLEGAREMIDMLDALREKTRNNLAPEEEMLVMDVLGNLKLAYMELTKAAAAAAMQNKAKSR